MGYRELLKRYICHVQSLHADDFLDAESAPPWLSGRDLAELRLLAAEAARDAWVSGQAWPGIQPNAELRRLLRRHRLAARALAALAGFEPDMVECWAAPPSSPRYRAMTEIQLRSLENAVVASQPTDGASQED